MSLIHMTLLAVVVVAASGKPGGYGGAQSYASISSPVVASYAAPAVASYAAPAVASYAAPAVTAYAAPAVTAYAAPAVASYAVPAVSYKTVEPEIIAYPRYAFKYGVQDGKTGDVKDQVEERDGDVVKGEYSLLQPDGRKRVVNYVCDGKNGCNQLVSYSGQAVYPQVVQAVQVPVKVATAYAPSQLSAYSAY